jgi:hypothetical protein
VNIVYPFLDPALAAFTWGLAPQWLRDNGIEKVILREAVADILPESVSRRRDKADARALMHAGLTEGAAQIRAVAAGGPLVDHDIVDPAKLSAAVNAYLAGQSDLGAALWATVSVNT